METLYKKRDKTEFFSSYRTYEEWKRQKCTKNGNAWISFLPYLWGMETRSQSSCVIHYPLFLPYLWGMETCVFWVYRLWFLCSYRTYEEWKRDNALRIFDTSFRSYRTYEEWKRKHIQFGCAGAPSVLTVPMRNGNFLLHQVPLQVVSSYRTYEEWKRGELVDFCE